MTADLTVEAHDLDGVARLRNAWQDLADRCLEPDVFAEPAFLLPAARHLAGCAPTFFTVWQGARLVGLCPIAEKRWPGPFPARVWTHPQATTAVPLLDRDAAAAVMAALLVAVGQGRGRPGGLVMTGLVCDGATAGVFADNGLPLAWLDPRPRAVLLRGGQAPGLRGRARKELRRQWNRLADQGAAGFVSAREPEAIAAALDCFLALEVRGWKGRRGTALGSTPTTRAFAVAAITGLAAAGRCRIDSVSLDGRAIAMGIVLRSRDRGYFWKTAYDEAFARASPGLQLASRLTELQAADATLAETDSCAIPDHSMIDRLWPDRWQVADGLASTRGERGTAFEAVGSVERLRRWGWTRAKSAMRVVKRR